MAETVQHKYISQRQICIFSLFFLVMNHFLSITGNFIGANYRNGISLMWHCRVFAGISGQDWQALDGPELLRRLVTRALASARQHEPAPSSFSEPHSLTGDHRDQSRVRARHGSPGHTRNNLIPVSRVPGDQRETIPWSWAEGRGCEITRSGHQPLPGVRSLVTTISNTWREQTVKGGRTLAKCPIAV